ncbi:MAG: hypothetical protein JSW40_08090 [Candidatus Omnitrophota bacterium]|nr:MAG: hypothetical protein JSW40_08090 [Candidatus Omnitrophota bacterium]
MIRKLGVYLVAAFFVLCCSIRGGWAQQGRSNLKERFSPSKNLRQMQNLISSDELDYQSDSYYRSEEGARKTDRKVARKPQPSQQQAEPVVGEYAIYQSEYLTTIEEEIAFIEGKVRFEVFKRRGWVKIPLIENVVGLKEASLNRKPSFVIREGNRYVLLVNKPGVYDLNLEFFIKVKREREHGPGSLSFQILPSPITILDVEMQETEVEIFVEPSIKIETERLAKKTLATVVLPYTERVTVRWSKALPKEIIPTVELEPKMYVDAVTVVSVGDGVAKCSSTLHYSILQSEVSNLRVSFPEDVSVLDVSGNQLRDWKIKPQDKRQLLDIYLNYGVKGSYMLNVIYEKNIGAGSVTAQLPEMNVLGTERQRGVVGIEAVTNIELAFNTIKGASRIDVKELPHTIWSRVRNPVLLAFKYLKVPYTVVIDVTKHEEIPVLVAAIDSANYVTLLTEEGKTLTKVTYQIRNNVKQFVRVSLPKDAELWSCFVSGKPVKPAKDKEGKILIPLEKSQMSQQTLTQFPVEVVYLTANKKLGLLGRLKMKLPELDIPANELFWSVYLPDKLNYYWFRGDVELAKRVGPMFMAKSTRALSVKDRERRYYDKLKKESRYAPVAEMLSQQVAMEEQVFDAVGGAQGRGVLPIRIHVPQRGKLYRFSKLLVTDESPWMSVVYSHSPWKIFGRLIVIALVIWIIWLVKRTFVKSATE